MTILEKIKQNKILQLINSFISESFPDIITDKELDSRKGFLKVSLIALIEFILIVLYFPMTYEISDDFVMNSFVSGAMFGEPVEYIFFTNIIIGKILKFLFNLIPNINWYTVYMLSSLLIAYITIQYSFYKLKTNYSLRIFSHLFILSFLLYPIHVSGFTHVATIVAAAGFLVIILNKNKKTFDFLLGLFLIILSSLIRYHIFLLFILLSIPILTILLFKKRYAKIIFILISIIISFFFMKYDKGIYDNNEELSQFKKLLVNHANLVARNKPEHVNIRRQNNAEDIEWSEIDKKMILRGLFYMDEITLKDENIKILRGQKMSFREKIDDKRLIQEFKHTYKSIWSFIEDKYYFFLPLLVVFLFFNFHEKRKIIVIALYAIYTLFIAFYLYYFWEGELKHRILYGFTIPFFLLVLFFINNGRNKKSISPVNIKKPYIKTLIINIAIAVFVFSIYVNKQKVLQIYNRRDRVNEYVEYINNQNIDFYVSRFVQNPYYIFKPPLNIENSYNLGWIWHFSKNNEKINRYTEYKTQNIYEIIDKDIIWFFGPLLNSWHAPIVEEYYLTKHQYCHLIKETIDAGGYPLYKHTYHIYSDSLKYFAAMQDTTRLIELVGDDYINYFPEVENEVIE